MGLLFFLARGVALGYTPLMTNTANTHNALSSLFQEVKVSGDLSSLYLLSGVSGLLNNGKIAESDLHHAEGAVKAALSCDVRATEEALSSLSYHWDRENLPGRKVMDQLALWAWRTLS